MEPLTKVLGHGAIQTKEANLLSMDLVGMQAVLDFPV
jgi:hypothetical protein